MRDRPGEHPEPPASLGDCKPLLFTMAAGTVVFRLHHRDRAPLFFGSTRDNRFDAPDGSFGALYVAMDQYCAFIETFGSLTGIFAVTAAFLEARHLAEITILKPLRLIDLAGEGGLARIRADGRLVTGSHALAQRWASALRNHPCRPDGILYPARHDLARKACVLFDCAKTNFRIKRRGSLMAAVNRPLLVAILKEYDFGLIE